MGKPVASSVSGRNPKLFGRFGWAAELGGGATGRVIEVVDYAAGEEHRALKIVSELEGQRLAWEWEVLSRLSHPNLVGVSGLEKVSGRVGAPFHLEGGEWVLVEDLAIGAPARRALRNLGDFGGQETIRWVLRLGLAVTQGLSALHARGLVHGDVKPENIIVGERPGDAVLVDLDLCRLAGRYDEIGGTPAYLAPEAWTGVCSASTDVFALGMTLHDLLGGELGEAPLSSLSPRESMLRAPAPRVRRALPGVDDGLEALLKSLCALSPSERISTAREAGRRIRVYWEQAFPEAVLDGDVWEVPSAEVRARGALCASLVGRKKELKALVAALVSGEPVVVLGPSGVGRTRLLREAARLVQVEAVRRGERPVRLYSWADGTAPDAGASRGVMHVQDADGWTLADLRRAQRSMALDQSPVTWCLERSEPLSGVCTVEVRPLSKAQLSGLVRAVIGSDPSNHMMRVAMSATAGLPGRCCRLLAQAMTKEGSWDSAAVFSAGSDAGALVGDLDEQERGALALFTVLGGRAYAVQIADGGVELSVLQRLRARGAIRVGRDGNGQLRTDWFSAVCDALPTQVAEQWARRALDLELSLHQRVIALAFAGDLALAAQAFCSLFDDTYETQPCGELGVVGRQLMGIARAAGFDVGEVARRLASVHRARGEYAEALGLLDAMGDDPEARGIRLEVLRLRGDHIDPDELADDEAPAVLAIRARLLLNAGRYDEAEELSVTLSEPGMPVSVRSRACEVLAHVARAQGQTEDARSLVLPLLREVAGSRAEPRLLLVAGGVAQAEGDFKRAAQCYAGAMESAEMLEEHHIEAHAAVNLGLVEAELGDLGAALDGLRRGGRRLARWGRDADLAPVLFNFANVALIAGDDDFAQSLVSQAHEAAEGAKDGVIAGYASLVRADLALRRGSLDAAKIALADARRAGHGRDARLEALAACRGALVQGSAGELDEAEARWGAIEDSVRSANSPFLVSEWCQVGARICGWRGRWEDAISWSEQALAHAERAGGFNGRLRATLVAADIAGSSGRADARDAMLAGVRRMLESAGQSLSPAGRALLRAVPEYKPAWSALPATDASSSRFEPWRELAKFAARLRPDLSLGQLEERILESALRLVPGERALLLEVGDESPMTILRGVQQDGGAISAVASQFSRSIAARALRLDKPIGTTDAGGDATWRPSESVHALRLRSVACVPFHGAEGRRLLLYMDDRLRPGAFGDEELALLAALVQAAGRALSDAGTLRKARRSQRREEAMRLRAEARLEEQQGELSRLRTQVGNVSVVAHSAPMRELLSFVEKAAISDAAVLLIGESGTGKEHLARLLHRRSPRAAADFVAESCAAIPAELAESVLFGHERGAFTGAVRAQRGLFERADGGTLYLDGIEDLPMSLQAKLLRVLQEGQVRRVGSTQTRKVDVRMVSSASPGLSDKASNGTFRQDLFYRLAVVRLTVPPLRERHEDLGPLVSDLIRRYGPERKVVVDPKALELLRAHAWPGNVRELGNALQSALVLAEDRILPEHLPAFIVSDGERREGAWSLKERVADLERAEIIRALKDTAGNQTRAATLLGVSRYGLQKMIKRLGVELDRFR